MGMEEKNEELNLKFESDEAAETLALARRELADDLAGEPAGEEIPEAAVSEEETMNKEIREPAGGPGDAPETPAPETPAPETPAPAAEKENVPRSRIPVNRPAGTQPLGETVAGHGAPGTDDVVLEGRSYGALLRELRERRNLDYAALEEVTKIAPRYLKALETENLDELPPVVYVIAYIRTLCRFYGISDARSASLLQELKKKMEYACTDELLNTVEIDVSGTEAHERLLRRILLGAAGAVILLIAVAGLWIYLAARPAPEKAPANGRGSAAAAQFDRSRLDPLLEPPTLELSRLPVAE